MNADPIHDKEADPIEPANWRYWLMAAWALGVLALFSRFIVEALTS